MKIQNNEKRVFIDPKEYEEILARIFFNIESKKLKNYFIESRIISTSKGKSIELTAKNLIEEPVNESSRSALHIIKEIIRDLEEAVGQVIPEEDILREAEIKGIKQEEAKELLVKLNRAGDIFKPKKGYISRA